MRVGRPRCGTRRGGINSERLWQKEPVGVGAGLRNPALLGADPGVTRGDQELVPLLVGAKQQHYEFFDCRWRGVADRLTLLRRDTSPMSVGMTAESSD